jgi:hypothetical protein
MSCGTGVQSEHTPKRVVSDSAALRNSSVGIELSGPMTTSTNEPLSVSKNVLPDMMQRWIESVSGFYKLEDPEVEGQLL